MTTEKPKRLSPYPLRLEPQVRFSAEAMAKKARWSLHEWIKVAVEEKIQRDTEKRGAIQ